MGWVLYSSRSVSYMEWVLYSPRSVSLGNMLLDLMGLKDRTELLIPLVVVRVCGISASVVNEESKVIARGRTVGSPRQQVQQSGRRLWGMCTLEETISK